MRKITISLISVFILTAAIFLPTYAQYERKLSLPFSLGPTFLVSDHLFDPGVYDAGGVQLNFMLQHNLSRKFSVVWGLLTDVYLSRYNFYKNSYELQNGFMYVGLSVAGKYKFLAHRKTRPYVVGGISGGPAISFKPDFSFHDYLDFEKLLIVPPRLLTGLGFEWDRSETITYFVQLGINQQIVKGNSALPTSTAGYAILGVNINMFKSKSL